jgi:hypothetical protein
MRHRRTTLGLATAAIALSSHVPSADAATATIMSMNGPADIEKNGANVSRVTTGADTTVLVQIDAVHDLTVYQHTQVALGDSLGLRNGTLRARGALTIVTANALVRVNDGELTVAYDQLSGTTTVEVTDDGAEVRGTNDEPVAVPAGQMVRVGADGDATDPAPIVADVIAAARVAPSPRAGDSNLPYVVTAIASACVFAGLLMSRRARALLLPGD